MMKNGERRIGKFNLLKDRHMLAVMKKEINSVRVS